jgi:hypothetical protein
LNKIEIFVRHYAELDAFGYFQYIAKIILKPRYIFSKRLIAQLKAWHCNR